MEKQKGRKETAQSPESEKEGDPFGLLSTRSLSKLHMHFTRKKTIVQPITIHL